MLGVWNKVLVDFQQVLCNSPSWVGAQAFLPKNLTCFDRPSSTDKDENLAKDGVHREPVQADFVYYVTARNRTFTALLKVNQLTGPSTIKLFPLIV